MLLRLTVAAPPVTVPLADVGVPLPPLPPPCSATEGLFPPALPLTFLPVLVFCPAVRVDELVDFDRLSILSCGFGLMLITTPPGKSSSLSLAAIVSLRRVARGGGAGREGGAPPVAEAVRPLLEDEPGA